MKPELLEVIGKYAGLAGFALGFVVLIFSRIVRARLETVLPKTKVFQFYVLVVVLTWSLGLAGIITWAIADSNKTKSASDEKPDCTTASGPTNVTGSGNTTVVAAGCANATVNTGGTPPTR